MISEAWNNINNVKICFVKYSIKINNKINHFVMAV